MNQSKPDETEQHRYYILRSLAALGLGTHSDLRNHFMLKQNKAFSKTLQALLESGEVLKLKLQNEKDIYYALPKSLELLSKPFEHPTQLFILSPFDNVLILRSRLKRLFGFTYTLECYLPPQKRVYGYWCLPMLYKGKFVGRMDCKANRKSKLMEVLSLHWEPEIKPDINMRQALQSAFDRFAKFCGCDSIDL